MSRPSGEAAGRSPHHPLAQNTAALYGIHLATLLLPLVTIPFLARVLRPEGWGLVVFAQSFAAWLALVLEYGFSLSATRAIARSRDDAAGIAAAVAGVLGAKGILLLLLTGAAGIAYLAIPTFQADPRYLAWAWLLAAAHGWSPLWYFQGVERLRTAAVMEVATRGAATLGIFLLVRSPDDGWQVLALYALAGLLWAGLGHLWIYREVPFIRPRLADGIDMLRSGWTIFAYRGTAGVYMQANPFILGLFASAPTVAFFGGAERITRAAIGILHPLSQALYPRISHLVVRDRAAAGRLIRASLVLIGGMGLVLGASLAVGAPLLVRVLLGPGYEAAVPVLRLLAVLPPVVAVATVFGIQWALPMGYDRHLFAFVAAAGALNLIGAVLLVPRFGATGMAGAVILAEAAVACGLLWLAWTHAGEFWRWARSEELAIGD